jgi:hypothetical protein
VAAIIAAFTHAADAANFTANFKDFKAYLQALESMAFLILEGAFDIFC